MRLHFKRDARTAIIEFRRRNICARRGGAFAFAVASACALAAPGLAMAGTFTLECGRADVFNPMWNAPITFMFEGGERGTLKVAGALGEFEIPASRRPLQVESGKAGESIDGNAKAHIKLPALSDLETCIDKVQGTQSAGAENNDAFLNARDQCMRTLTAAPSGVDAVAQIRLGIDGESSGGEDAFVVFKLIYDAPSRAPEGRMVTEAFPAQCKIKK